MRVYLAFTIKRLLFNHAHIVSKSATRTSTHFAATVEPTGRPALLTAGFLAAAFGRRVVEDALLDGVLQEAPLAAVAPALGAATPSTN